MHVLAAHARAWRLRGTQGIDHFSVQALFHSLGFMKLQYCRTSNHSGTLTLRTPPLRLIFGPAKLKEHSVAEGLGGLHIVLVPQYYGAVGYFDRTAYFCTKAPSKSSSCASIPWAEGCLNIG
jgi:hypothetical protein